MTSWLGIKNVFSTLVHGTQPTNDTGPVSFEVWLSPSITAWDYVPTDRNRPYRLVRAECKATDAYYAYAECSTFVGLMTDFATENMPRRDETCVILDKHCNIVLGWMWDEDEGRFDWVGGEYAFSILAFHYPLEAAVWETRARERLDRPDLKEWA